MPYVDVRIIPGDATCGGAIAVPAQRDETAPALAGKRARPAYLAAWLAALLAGVLPLATGCADPASTAPDVLVAPPVPTPVSHPAPLGTFGSIHVAAADGSGARLLTAGSAPAWSPDGRRLAFYGGNGQIHVIDADGSALGWLAEGFWPSWSPDGGRLAFRNDDGIAVMNADGSGVRTLVRHDFARGVYGALDLGVGYPTWSPDGAHIAFTHLGGNDGEGFVVYLVNGDGSDVRPVTDGTGGARRGSVGGAWSPDGSRLVYVAWDDPAATSFLVVTDLRGGPDVRLGAPTGAAWVESPAWSPDGRAIAFVAPAAEVGRADVWVMPASGGAARLLVRDAAQPAWSPDGTRIAFVRAPDPLTGTPDAGAGPSAATLGSRAARAPRGPLP